MITTDVLKSIVDERDRQSQELGYTTLHDDQHTVAEWSDIVCFAASKAVRPGDDRGPAGASLDLANARKRFVQVAAIAIAAAESMDRHEVLSRG